MQVVDALTEEALREGVSCHRRMLEVRVQPLQQPRSPGGFGRTCPEPAHLGFPEQVVAGEHFVRALAGQHHLVALGTHPLGKQHERRRRRANDRRLGMPYGAGKGRANRAARAVHRRVRGAEVANQLLLEVALVELPILKSEGEGP